MFVSAGGAGTVWGDDVPAAEQRLPALRSARALWLEEPFVSGALQAYARLAAQAGSVKLAGGEGCHNYHQAQNMIDYAGLGFVQIDAGRIAVVMDEDAAKTEAPAPELPEPPADFLEQPDKVGQQFGKVAARQARGRTPLRSSLPPRFRED